MASTNQKAPPTFEKGQDYAKWIKKLKIWRKLTSLEANKQGPAVLFALFEEAQDAVLELDESKIAHASGVENIIECLDKLYLQDKTQTAFDALEAFEGYKRPTELSISEYCNEFEKRWNKAKSYGTTMSDDVLAYRLLKSANLPESQQQLAKATIGELKYDNMKTQLKKIHGCKSNSLEIKEENIEPLVVEDESYDETLIQTNFTRGYGSGTRSRGSYRPYSADRGRGYPRYSRGNYNVQGARKKGKNPLDQYGNMTTCLECGSRNHWLNDCPDRKSGDRSKQTFFHECSNYGASGDVPTHECCDYNYDEGDENFQITLFQSNFDEPGRLKSLVGESLNCGVLDSGASKTVCGKPWFKAYLESLREVDKKRVSYESSMNIFKFGDGKKVGSLKRATIPAVIGSVETTITTDIVDSDIPLLLSRSSMKRAGTELNFKDDTVSILGQNLPLRVTNSGHYALPISRNQYLLEKVKRNSHVNVTLSTSNLSNEEIASKLHSQFSHPPASKLVQLLQYAEKDNDELVDLIRKKSKECRVCQEYQRPPSRPVVGLPMATTFGECVAMDLKFFHGKILLHLIDHATRLSAGAVVRSKCPKEIIRQIFRVWISVYGFPEKNLMDNGGEFSNELLRQLGEKANITIKTTAAESPWSNGLCERHNQVLGQMLEKTIADTGCNLDMAVSWCINAKNSLQNVYGFSPFQLVFGRNPRLPGILVDRPPALDDFTTDKILRDNLNALHASRRAFLASECSEKLRRALRRNIRSSGDIKYFTGDKIYYKRAAEARWRGPAVVLGQDGQQVLVKHGGIYVRVHPCRLSLIRSASRYSQQSEDSSCMPEEGHTTGITPTQTKNDSKGDSICKDLNSEENSESEDDKNSNEQEDSNDDDIEESASIEVSKETEKNNNDDNQTMENLVNNTNRPRGRPPSGKAKTVKSKNDSLKVGMIVKYKIKTKTHGILLN